LSVSDGIVFSFVVVIRIRYAVAVQQLLSRSEKKKEKVECNLRNGFLFIISLGELYWNQEEVVGHFVQI
jgi:hypothetical protein